MAKGLFSFLFSDSSTGTETGSKTEGKGNTELVSMGNEEAAIQVQISKNKETVKGKNNDTPDTKVAKSEKRKYKNPKQKNTSNTKLNSRRKQMKKVARTRELEINNDVKNLETKYENTRKSSLYKDNKMKAVKDFLDKLPPETQSLIKKQMQQKINKEPIVNQEKRNKYLEQKDTSKQELLDSKRGIKKEKTALQLAKIAAEKARKMVKAVRDRVLNQSRKQKPEIQNQNTQNQTKQNNTISKAKIVRQKESR